MIKATLKVLFFVAACFLQFTVSATHVIGGEIIARRVNNGSLTYEIRVIGYRDLDSSIIFGGGVLRTGDGEIYNGPFQITGEQIDSQTERVFFTITHTFKGPSAAGYIISYQEDFRNDGIININGGNSVQTTFYIETKLVIDPFLGSNSTPVLANPPLLWAQSGKIYQTNPGAYDPDGDLLTYRIADVQRAFRTQVGGYQSPVDRSFYTNHAEGNAAGDGPPSFEIDKFSGVLTWDAPGDISNNGCESGTEYSIAIAIDEWRNIRGSWFKLGYVVRDYNIKIDHCKENQPPVLALLPDTCLVAGEQFTKQMVATNPDEDPIIYRADGEPLELRNGAEYTASEESLDFEWTPACADVRNESYQVYFRVTDRISSGAAFSSVSPLSITVRAPEVTGLDITDVSPGSVKLSWDPYTCSNADSMEIWRKEGTFSGKKCDLIHPEDQDFQLIGKVPISQLSFTDNSITSGSNSNDFTYHLKATFPGNVNDPDEFYEVLTGTDEVSEKHQIRIFPNPTSGTLKIDPVRSGWRYKLYDLSGRLLEEEVIDPSGVISQSDSRLDGVYIFMIEDQHDQTILKSRLIFKK